MDRVVVVEVGVWYVLLVCWVTVVVVWGVGFPVLVVLTDKHDVSDKMSIKELMPIMSVGFIRELYSQPSRPR